MNPLGQKKYGSRERAVNQTNKPKLPIRVSYITLTLKAHI